MFSKIFKPKKAHIGIDVSDGSIEVVKLTDRKTLDICGRIHVPYGVINNGRVVQKKVFVERLQELLSKLGLTSKGGNVTAVLNLPEPISFAHYFEMGFGADEDSTEYVKEVIKEQASKAIPLDLNRSFWGYSICSHKSSLDPEKTAEKEKKNPSENKTYKVLVAASPKDALNDYLETIRLAGVSPVAIEPESFALSRALLTGPADGSSMIIDVGANKTTVGIFDEDLLQRLSFTIPRGGNHITSSIAERLKIDWKDAEKLKLSANLHGKELERVLLSLEELCDEISKEIKEAIVYYENLPASPIKNILLTGGSALMPKIDEYIALKLGRQVTAGNALQKIPGEWPSRKAPPLLFTNAVGLALYDLEESENKINILEQVSQEKKALSGWLKMPKVTKFIPKINLGDKVLKKLLVIALFVGSLATLGFILYKYIYKAPFLIENKSAPAEASTSTEPGATPAPATIEATAATTSTGPENALPSPLPTPEPTPTEQKIIIQNTPTGWLNVRSGPGSEFPVAKRVLPGEIYVLIEEKEEWYKIKINGEEGWISDTYAKKE